MRIFRFFKASHFTPRLLILIMDSDNLFSFKWSLKRNFEGDSKATFARNNQAPPESQINETVNKYDCKDKIQTFADQKGNQKRQPFQEDAGTADEIHETHYEVDNHLYNQDSQLRKRVDELTTAAKKLKLEEVRNTNSSTMDVDFSSSGKLSLDTRKNNFNFEQAVNELRQLEKKYCEWLTGERIPSKEGALQMLGHSVTMLQSFQEISKIRAEEEITHVLELSRLLVESIKGSIAECNTCSMELMDFQSCSLENTVIDKMSCCTNSNEPENVEACPPNLEDWERDPSEQLLGITNPVDSLGNLSLDDFSHEELQQSSDTSSSGDTLYQEDPSLRAEKVKAIRAVLLPGILDMLGNYEEWCKRYFDQSMFDFLELRNKQTQRETNSADNTIGFNSRNSN